MPGNAAIYIADPSLMGSRFFNKIEGILSYEGLTQGDSATGIRFTLDVGQVTMNFMPEDQLAQHLTGFNGFAQHVIKNRDQLIYLQSRIHYVRLVCGCVITPDFDEADEIQSFLLRFNRAANGLLFLPIRFLTTTVKCLADDASSIFGSSRGWRIWLGRVVELRLVLRRLGCAW